MQNQVNRCVGLAGWLASTIGQKYLIGITGLGLSLFLLTHMAANMLILVGPDPYNLYSHKLISNPLIYVAEVGLIGLFLGHLVLALRLSWKNFRARDSRYAVLSSGTKRTTLTQRSLWAQGLLILVFLILHLITFKFGNWYTTTVEGIEMRDLHKLVVEVFQEPAYVAWYIVAMIVLFFHLKHGVASSFQSLGINHPRYSPAIKCMGIGYAVIVVLGFLSQPIYVFFIRG